MTNQPLPLRVGLLGCGNVGSALVTLLAEQRQEILLRTGLDLQISRIAVRDVTVDRGIDVATEVFTDDPQGLVADPDIDLVVELIGGIEPARTLILAALAAGKPVVTGNKALVAEHGAELFAEAEAGGVDLLFEAAVAGGIPLIRPLRESLLGEPIKRVLGIVNGTTNYILTQMTENGASYTDALADAQALGYAEADPTADVEGFDAGAKAAIIATIAFGVSVTADDVHHEGISEITIADIDYATRHDHVIKLIAVAEQVVDGAETKVGVRVHPALVPCAHPLASVRDSFNAVFIEGGAVGELMLYGRGAGGEPTASAVLGDLIDAASNLRAGTHARFGPLPPAQIMPISDLRSAYSLTLHVNDEPGVLGQVATTFGQNNVSIQSMEQAGASEETGNEAQLVFVTHLASESDVRATLDTLRDLDAVRSVGAVIRVVGN